jgi:hypothetical protein
MAATARRTHFMADIDTASTSLAQQPGLDNVLDELAQSAKRAKECLKVIEGTSKKAIDAEERLAEFLAKAGEAQMKADNEALRASHAKGLVEEHAGAAAKLKGSIEIDAAAISKKREEVDAIAQSFVNLRSTSESDGIAIANARKTADESAKTVAETSGKATSIQASILETKKGIEDLSQAVHDECKNIKTDVSEVTSAKGTSAVLLAAIQKATAASNELQERSKSAHLSIETLEKSAKAKAELVNELVDKSLELQKKVSEYESNLTNLKSEFVVMKDKIEGLLPGATSAGLASAFSSQRKHFEGEREKWGKILVGSLGLLMVTVIVVGTQLRPGADEWGSILRHFLERLPYMVPPLWLAVYAGHQHMLATRMEEEYATKDAVSTSFEGYKREMASDPEAAKALCNNVLAIIARRPGLVYEGKQQNMTAFSPVVEAVQNLIPLTVEAVMAKIKGGVPTVKG